LLPVGYAVANRSAGRPAGLSIGISTAGAAAAVVEDGLVDIKSAAIRNFCQLLLNL
jgi:hypothetical protein